MQVKAVLEQEDGSVEFEGTLSPKEVQLVVTVGLNFLLQTGAAPFLFDKSELDEDDTLQ